MALIALQLQPAAWALDPSRELAQYNCRTWTRQSGLPVNGINAIAETPDGYLWLGTAGGLIRFDGIDFRLTDFSVLSELRTTVVRSLLSTDQGLWVGLENSAFGFYDGNAFSFRGKPDWGGVDMNVRAIFRENDGSLVILSQLQAARLYPNGKYKELYAAGERNIISAFRDNDGSYWMGTSRHGAYHLTADGKTTKLEALADESVMSIIRDKRGDLWVGLAKGVRRFDVNLNPKPLPPLDAEVRSLMVDKNGAVWIGTDVLGLLRYRNGQYESFLPTQGLADAHVNALFEDGEGSLWVATSGGLSQVTDVKFPTLPSAENRVGEPAATVYPSRKGGIWIGGRETLSYLDGGSSPKLTTYSKEAGFPEGLVKRIYEMRNGDIYAVCGLTCLVKFSGGKVVSTLSADNLVVGITEDAQGPVVSVGPHLDRVVGNTLVPYSFRGDAPNFKWVLQLVREGENSFWVVCETGLFLVKDGAVLEKFPAAELGGLYSESFAKESNGTIWVGLLGGMARIKDNKITVLTRKTGLLDNNIYGVEPDNVGNVWLDSSRGIFRLPRQNIDDFAAGKISHVTSIAYDGIESVNPAEKTDLQERLGCKSIDGRVWFPSSKGVVEIQPSRILTNTIPPPVRIGAVIANRVPLSANQRLVPPGQGELEFQFTALSFIAPLKTQFKYKLNGYDDAWVEAGSRRVAFYTNLEPGVYTFHVIAANADGVWNETGASRTIELQPHFGQTAWFYALCGIAVVAGLGGAYWLRVRQLNFKQKSLQEARDRLETEVGNRTAELANVNESLKNEVDGHKRTELQLVERTESLENEIEERKQMQKEIERVHRALVDTSRQAGMAEIATNVLHNVGNVLNSVNVSCAVVLDTVRASSSSGLAKVVALLKEHENDLGAFISADPRGKHVLVYLAQLSERIATEKDLTLKELESLRHNIEHIKEIVTMQQNYATVSGVHEIVNIRDLVEDSLRMNTGALDRHGVQLFREFEEVPPINVDKHKVLQILVNFVRNAKYACDESGRTDKRVTVRIARDEELVKIAVSDNGVGITPENLTRIFNHGFTTRKDGHGFGLHSGSIAAKEMGGNVRVQSDGPGEGATFVLELPTQPKRPGGITPAR